MATTTPSTRPTTPLQTTDSPYIGAAVVLGLRELLAEIDTRRSGWDDEVRQVARVARAAHARLDLRLVASTDRPQELRSAIAEAAPTLVRIGVFDPRTHAAEDALRAIATEAIHDVGAQSHIEVLAGTRAHFTELNRGTAALPADAPLTFSITSQMHAIELRHTMESRSTLPDISHAARAIAGGRPLRIGPVTIGPRFNAVATSADSPVDPLVPLDDLVDHPALPAWTLASIVGLVGPTVGTICVGSAGGPVGMLDVDGRPTGSGIVLAMLAAHVGAAIEVAAVTTADVRLRFDDHDLAADLTGSGLSSRSHTRPSGPYEMQFAGFS